ncbi:hypothetical protein ZOSMA_39G00030 [Zostera marina]|uniref:VASt domain-containing protein n=1 Tax=Zostera marina TaxID=29655 RepID=A0A0K9P692_ZOSMR|nr:hypothetical protein ZOSMA_39G00030 [Zostera marina]
MAVVSPIKDKIDQFGTLAQQNQLQSLSPASSDRSSKKYEIEPAASDDASSAYSGETSDRRDTDISVQILPTKSEEYRLMFRLPGDEVLLQNFNCALQENIPLQGHMYLFAHHICFYSNIFGFETKKKISFTEITSVQKAKTAAIFPTAIEIFAGEKKHFFGSFLSRDEAYEFIVYRWALHNSEVRDSFECQDSKFDNGQDVFISDSENNTKEQKFDGPYCADREPVGEISRSEEALSWQFEDADAPTVPDYFSKVVETNFPVSLEEFFSLFLSDAAIDFLQKFHKICGDKDFQFGRWCHHENSGLTRNISFQHPIKIYLGAKFGLCEEIQKFHAYKNR